MAPNKLLGIVVNTKKVMRVQLIKSLKCYVSLSRNFRCDCGNSKFKNLQCKLLPVSLDVGFIYTVPGSWCLASASAGSHDASAFPSKLNKVGVLQQEIKSLRG